MKIYKTYLSGIILILGALGVWYVLKGHTPALPDTATSSLESTTTSVASTSAPSIKKTLPATPVTSLDSRDSVASWNFKGYLNDNGPREAAAQVTLNELKAKLGGAEDYQLCIALAQEYDYLGEGKLEYEYLSRAIAIDSNSTSGVAWHNLGVLMEKLGAYYTARTAHDQAVHIQPGISAFQISRVEFMIYHFPKDTAGVEKAFTDAAAILGADSPLLLDLRNRWKAE